MFALYQRGFQTELRRAYRRGIAARAAPYHDQIELHFTHKVFAQLITNKAERRLASLRRGLRLRARHLRWLLDLHARQRTKTSQYFSDPLVRCVLDKRFHPIVNFFRHASLDTDPPH